MNITWRSCRPVLGIFLVLVFGALLGALVTWKVMLPRVYDMGRHSPDELSMFVTDRLSDILNFSPDQYTKVKAVIRGHIRQFREIHKKIDADVEQLRSQSQQGVRDLLTDDQKKIWDTLVSTHSRKLMLLSGPSPLLQDPSPADK